MLLIINEKNEIIEFAKIGGLPNAIEFTKTMPDDFESRFKPSFYLLKNNEIVLNPNYVEPTPPKPATGPTTEQQMINQLGLQVATLTAEVNQLKGGVSNV